MNESIIGIILFAIVMILSLSTFFTIFISKKITRNYFFWSIPAIIFVTYFIDIRFFNDWVYFFEDNSFITGKELGYFDSLTVSKALLLDLCPLLAIILPLSLVFDKTRKSSYVLAPFCILGGVVTFVSILSGATPGGDVNFTFEYIFIGYDSNELYFFLHSYLIVIGSMLVFHSNVNRFKYLWTYYLFIITYFLYILIIVKSVGVVYNTTGISIRDWLPASDTQPYPGEYYGMSEALGSIVYPWVMMASYSIGFLVINAIIFLQIRFRNFDPKKQIYLN